MLVIRHLFMRMMWKNIFKGRERALELHEGLALFYDENEIRKRQERWKKEDEEERRLLAAEEALLMPKIGRNDPCPCGSGKKYKKCCLGKEMLH